MTSDPFPVPESRVGEPVPRTTTIRWIVFGEQVGEVEVGTVTASDKATAEHLGQQLARQHGRRLIRVQSVASRAVAEEERKVAARHRQKGWRDPDPAVEPPALASLREALRAHRASRPARRSSRTEPESAA